MKKIISSRGTGKTAKIIQMSAANGSYIVCHSLKEANEIQNRASEMGLKIPLPITYHEFLHQKYYLKGVKGFLLEDVDIFLQSLAPGIPIEAITARSSKSE